MNKNATIKSRHALNSYFKTLMAFKALPQEKRGRTIMEVSGYPHYENVASNILAFYFDFNAEHGLKHLLLLAFLRMVGISDLPAPCQMSVKLRQGTASGKQVDLIIDTELVTIGIENKIFHTLENDLNDYACLIERLGQKKPHVIKAVLGLHPFATNEMLDGGFVAYTYGQLWCRVREMLGQYIGSASPKWVAFLIDFMNTTTNLAGENLERNECDRFFVEHHEILEQMFAERDQFIGRLAQKVEAIKEMFANAEEVTVLCRPPWIWEKLCLALDFQFEKKFSIAFDLNICPVGWELQLFGRNTKSQAHLNLLLKNSKLKKRTGGAPLVNDRYVVQRWTVDTDLGKIFDALKGWIRALNDASK